MRLRNSARHRYRRRVPQLNTTATADISFMLLIFFLVTTSMDTDKGLRRQLPPKETRKELRPTDVDRATVLTLGITADNRLTISDTTATDKAIRRAITHHVSRLGAKHIIEVTASGEAEYGAYFHLQDLIVASYRTVREEAARRQYRRPFAALTAAEQQTIRTRYPQRVSEQFSVTPTGKEANDASEQ